MAARDQQEAEADVLLVGERHAVDLRLDQHAEDVVGRSLATLPAQLLRQDGDVDRALGRGRRRHRVARLPGEEVVGPPAGVVVALGWDAEHGADHGRGQQRRELVDDVELRTALQ